MTIITPICDRIELLAFYLQYYQRQGVERFVVALYNGKKSPLHDAICRIGNRMRVDLHIRPSVTCPLSEFNGSMETPGINLIREEFIRASEWFAIADLDEFIRPLQGSNLIDLASKAMASGYPAVHGPMVDRIAATGQFPAIDPDKTLDEQFPFQCDLTEACGAMSSKIFLSRGNLEVTNGHHQLNNGNVSIMRDGGEVHHFKWTSGIVGRLQNRLKHFRAQRLPWAEESATLLKVIENGINLADPNLKARIAQALGI
jgi:hypothetical protein